MSKNYHAILSSVDDSKYVDKSILFHPHDSCSGVRVILRLWLWSQASAAGFISEEIQKSPTTVSKIYPGDQMLHTF